jgi:hypothetical protein
LALYRNNIGDDGARAIAGSSTLTNLISLDLGENNIGVEGRGIVRGRFPFAIF